jgi:hypothetical protein
VGVGGSKPRWRKATLAPDRKYDWRKTVGRGARSLYLTPLVALVVGPVAVPFRWALVALALWHAYGVWRFTAGDAPSATLRLGRWALRATALAGVALITLDYEGYRALLIATVAAYLAYLSELLPALGLSSRRALRPAALGAVVCAALVAADLALRRWVNGADWGTMPGHCLALLAVPLGLLAWLEVSRVRAPGLEAKSKAAPAHWFPVRAWALKLRVNVLTFSIAFGTGAGVALLSLIGGFILAWEEAGGDPGVLRYATLFGMLCLDGALLLVLRKCRRQTLRRAVIGAGLTHIPLWWLLVFPTQFDASAWHRSPAGSQTRSDMAEDLIYSRALLGKTRAEVVDLIGSPDEYRAYGSPADAAFYSLRGHACKGFVVRFEREKVDRAELWFCD